MRFLSVLSALSFVLMMAAPASLEATNRGFQRNDRNDGGYSRFGKDDDDRGKSNRYDDDEDNRDGRYGRDDDDRDRGKDWDDDGKKFGHNKGKGHHDHGKGRGKGHDHHDHDPPISPHKPKKEARKYACSFFGKPFGFGCFCGRH